MSNIFFVSDTHFGHAATIFKFKTPDGKPMRPFQSVEEMDEFMVSEWNHVVKPQDKVYHLGDVAMKKEFIATVGRCNGHKRLVRSNHDDAPTKVYMAYFEEIYATRQFDDFLLSHIPVHPESLPWGKTNVHGHVHSNVGALHFGPNYLNISVEVTEYRPLSMEEVKVRVKAQHDLNQQLVEENLSRMGIRPLTL